MAALLAILPRPGVSQWVEPPGQGWSSLTLYHQDAEDHFDPHGVRDRFPGNGRSVATAAFLTVAAGLARGVDAWVQAPLQRLSFEDVTGHRSATGIGDVRLYLRINPLLFRESPMPVAIRTGVKLPVGDFDVGSELLPLGDGQRDWEVMLELGRSFYPRPLYVMGWAGYRWREAREEGRWDFGNERFFYAAAGGDAGRVGLKLALEGWYGETPLLNAVQARGAEREMLRASPSLLLELGPGQAEVGGRVPLRGRNLPAGTELVVGYFTRFDLR